MTFGKFSRMFTGRISFLKQNLNLTQLVDELRDRSVITKPQVEYINQKMLTDNERVERLLSMLEQRPDSDWDKFCDALRDTNQDKILELFTASSSTGTDSSSSSSSAVNTTVAIATTGLTANGAGPSPTVRCLDAMAVDDDVDVPDVVDVVVKHTTQEFYDDHYLDAYPMHRKQRGIAYIINVYQTTGHGNRDGTDADRDKLIKLFDQMHFRVEVFNDDSGLTAQGILEKVKYTAGQLVDGKKPQCYVLFILSHGDTDSRLVEVLYGNDGLPLAKKDVLRALIDDNLRSTPRLVCFVSCRGNKVRMDDEADLVEIPSDGHFIVGFPCEEDYVSIRNRKLGTRYVRCLVDLFMNAAHDTDVESLLNQVNSKLKELVDKTNGRHQIAKCHHNLKRKLYMFPGYTE